MERSLSSANAHFRIKLLQAAAQLQVSLGCRISSHYTTIEAFHTAFE
jgi:hypothetical protein